MAAHAARGLAYEAVKTAADKLVAGGKPVAKITLRDIRDDTGTGSLDTIGDHLLRYRLDYMETVAEDDVDPAELDQLIAPIRDIVVRKVRKVNERRDLEQAGERERAGTQKENLAFAISQNQILEEELLTLRDRNRDLDERLAGTVAHTAGLQGKLDEARARYDDLVSRLLPQAATNEADLPAVAAASPAMSPSIASAVADLVSDLRHAPDRNVTDEKGHGN